MGAAAGQRGSPQPEQTHSELWRVFCSQQTHVEQGFACVDKVYLILTSVMASRANLVSNGNQV